MSGMVSSTSSPRVRKSAVERRGEIVAVSAALALADGLESITLRAVAERLSVRPGLISHYFPAVEELIAAAFSQAVSDERSRLFPREGEPLARIADLVSRVQSPDAIELAGLWLNARHLARFSARIAACIEEQERLDRERLTEVIEEGVVAGVFSPPVDPFAACVRILVAIDGFGAYVNNRSPFEDAAYTRFVADVAEWTLGLEPGALDEVAPQRG